MKELAYQQWIELANKYCSDEVVIQPHWERILKKYSERGRYYHNLHHIWAMLRLCTQCKDELKDPDTVRFSIWFHDLVYKSTNKDNEYKSAVLAKKMLESFSCTSEEIQKVYDFIMSTKNHQILDSSNSDNAYLLDFDLSILGKPWKEYQNYTQQIRKEYKIYPNFLYNRGRKKVLRSFLNRDSLYFTEKYRTLYEAQARENVKREIHLLS